MCVFSSAASQYSHPSSIASPSPQSGWSPKTTEKVRTFGEGANRTLLLDEALSILDADVDADVDVDANVDSDVDMESPIEASSVTG